MTELEKIGKNNFVNLFADFLVNKLDDKKESIIEIVDFTNFIVVKGKTTSDFILNLNELKTEFYNIYSDKKKELKIGNTIDLIDYSCDLIPDDTYSFDFFNTTNLEPEVCQKSVKSMLSKSEFPCGYSLCMGKKLFYYAKHLVYNIQNKYVWDRISIVISEKNPEVTFEIYVDDCSTQDSKIRSSILDCFDFNFSWIDKNYKEKNFELDFLKKLNPDFIIF